MLATGNRARRAIGWRRAPSLAVAAVCVALLLVSGANAQPKFPPLTGRVVDEAGLLTEQDRRALDDELKALEDKSTDQVVVLTIRSLQGYEIEDFGYRLGRAWQIGQKGKNNGAVLIVAPNERKVRIEVGRGLEPELTDLLTKLIIENAILPAFRRGDFAGGIKAGVHDIRDVLLGDAEAVKARARSGAKRSSGDGEAVALAFLVFFVLLAFAMVWMQTAQTAHPNRYRGYRRGTTPVIIPGGWGGSSGGWGGGSSGGGFSGGGGDFGGGGSSGSW
jgi:uncharacterized protein